MEFVDKVKSPSFTIDELEAENGGSIKVEMRDSFTRLVVPPGCPLSSAKARVVVLDSEFWKSKGEIWSRSDFNLSVLREREGQGPILTGAGLTFQLENGVGHIENIVFRDNSSWTKSGFRLGVEVEGKEGLFNGERIREGVSYPFRVKDRRGKGKNNSQSALIMSITVALIHEPALCR